VQSLHPGVEIAVSLLVLPLFPKSALQTVCDRTNESRHKLNALARLILEFRILLDNSGDFILCEAISEDPRLLLTLFEEV